MNFFNSYQRTMIGMTLLLGYLLIFLIHRVRSSHIHSALSISRKPITYCWILYNNLNSTIISASNNTLSSMGSSMILDNMIFHQDLDSHRMFGRIL
jgi:hypothetical protein